MNNKKSNLVTPKAPERPVDILVKKSRFGLKSQFLLVGSHQVKVWHMLVSIAFVAGVVSALVWAGVGDRFVKTSAAPGQVKSQVTATYQDASGGSYGPVYSNEVTVPTN